MEDRKGVFIARAGRSGGMPGGLTLSSGLGGTTNLGGDKLPYPCTGPGKEERKQVQVSRACGGNQGCGQPSPAVQVSTCVSGFI
jgi:hypothetical protein